jgi:phosphoribosylglycinamide formyltransferase-1
VGPGASPNTTPETPAVTAPATPPGTARTTAPGPARIGVLASGSGTILEAIAAALPVSLVLVDRPCRAVDVAEAAAIPAVLVDRSAFGGFGPAFDRDGYTRAVTDALVAGAIDVVVMAGFGTVLGEPIHAAYPGRILNTHPALLPAFPGWHAVRDALAAGVTETGTTVHIATVQMDAGPVLARATVPVLPDDTEETLHERIKSVERTLYPDTIRTFVDRLAATAADGSGSPTEVAP